MEASRMSHLIVYVIVLFNFFIIQGFKIEKFQEIQDKEQVINIINNNKTNYFMVVPEGFSDVQRIDYIIDKLNNFEDLYVLKDNLEVLGMITLIKRPAPSNEYAEKLKLLGEYYANFIQMMLSDPSLPEKSDTFVMRVSLIIKENHRNKGYGKKLMRFAESFAKQDPEIQAITLNVKDENLAAIKLYESLGYKKICHNTKIKQISYRLSLYSL